MRMMVCRTPKAPKPKLQLPNPQSNPQNQNHPKPPNSRIPEPPEFPHQIDDGYDGGAALQWLPLKLPAKMRLLLTTRRGCAAYDACVERCEANGWALHQLSDLGLQSLVCIGNQHCKLRTAWTDVKDGTLGPQVWGCGV